MQTIFYTNLHFDSVVDFRWFNMIMMNTKFKFACYYAITVVTTTTATITTGTAKERQCCW